MRNGRIMFQVHRVFVEGYHGKSQAEVWYKDGEGNQVNVYCPCYLGEGDNKIRKRLFTRIGADLVTEERSKRETEFHKALSMFNGLVTTSPHKKENRGKKKQGYYSYL